MNTVRFTGAGGRGVVAAGDVDPHAETARALPASIAIVLVRIVGVGPPVSDRRKGRAFARNPR
jgi:hypothetical protein